MSMLTTCTKGDDTACRSLYKGDSCCAYYKMVDMPSGTLTSTQSVILAAFELQGMPSAKGESAHVCTLSAEELKAQFGASDE